MTPWTTRFRWLGMEFMTADDSNAWSFGISWGKFYVGFGWQEPMEQLEKA